MNLRAVAVAVSACSLLACGASSNPGGGGGDPLDGGPGRDGDASADGADARSTFDSGGSGDAGLIGDIAADSGPPPASAAVYAHSSTTLYKLDPTTLAITVLGDFKDAAGGAPISQVTDIALDKDGVMFGVTFSDLYKIDYKGGPPRCTHLATLSTSFNGLTFVPAGMIDPAAETLIGNANDGGWWRIDVKAGASSATLTQLGSYGGGFLSSGDSVGIIGDTVYATVNQSTLGIDHVIVVDPKTGAMKKDLGSTGVSGLYGVGYWGGTMYGFASSGSLYSIDLTTAKATEIPLADKPAGGWWGAGVTTSAPVTIK